MDRAAKRVPNPHTGSSGMGITLAGNGKGRTSLERPDAHRLLVFT